MPASTVCYSPSFSPSPPYLLRSGLLSVRPNMAYCGPRPCRQCCTPRTVRGGGWRGGGHVCGMGGHCAPRQSRRCCCAPRTVTGAVLLEGRGAGGSSLLGDSGDRAGYSCLDRSFCTIGDCKQGRDAPQWLASCPPPACFTTANLHSPSTLSILDLSPHAQLAGAGWIRARPWSRYRPPPFPSSPSSGWGWIQARQRSRYLCPRTTRPLPSSSLLPIDHFPYLPAAGWGAGKLYRSLREGHPPGHSIGRSHSDSPPLPLSPLVAPLPLGLLHFPCSSRFRSLIGS